MYIGVPKGEIKRRHDIDIDREKIENLDELKKNLRSYVTVEEICRHIGWN